MSVRRLGPALALVAVAASLASCTSSSGGPDPRYPYPFSTSIIDESRQSSEAPSGFRDRAPLPPCADLSLEQGEAIPDAAITCLQNAGSEGAELAVIGPTTEGDPIVSFYRIGPAIGGLEIWQDATRDRFGGGWHRSECSGTDAQAPTGCTGD